MNLKITKEEHEYLIPYAIKKFTVGSHLYGTNREGSDEDILVIYDDAHMMSIAPYLCQFLPNYHQFQYDDKENNKQFIYTTIEQFYKNLFSGDSTINADVVMFYPMVDNPLKVCRTYKVIKSFIGMAGRDLKSLGKGPKKLFHAHRGLYCAKMLLSGTLPTVDIIKDIYENSGKYFGPKVLNQFEKEVRDECNELYNKGELEKYYIPALPKSLLPYNTLMNKLIRSNNTKEFKYDSN